jgi:hypothetical protein
MRARIIANCAGADAELKCNNKKKEKNKISFYFFLERERERKKNVGVTKDRQQPRSDYLPNFTLLLLPFGFLLPFFFFSPEIFVLYIHPFIQT